MCITLPKYTLVTCNVSGSYIRRIICTLELPVKINLMQAQTQIFLEKVTLLENKCCLIYRQSHDEQVVGVRDEPVEDWRAFEEIRLFKKQF